MHFDVEHKILVRLDAIEETILTIGKQIMSELDDFNAGIDILAAAVGDLVNGVETESASMKAAAMAAENVAVEAAHQRVLDLTARIRTAMSSITAAAAPAPVAVDPAPVAAPVVEAAPAAVDPAPVAAVVDPAPVAAVVDPAPVVDAPVVVDAANTAPAE